MRLQNVEGVPPENSQRHSMEQEITVTLILKSHGMSATQILKKLDRRFLHGAGRLDNNMYVDIESSARDSPMIQVEQCPPAIGSHLFKNELYGKRSNPLQTI